MSKDDDDAYFRIVALERREGGLFPVAAEYLLARVRHANIPIPHVSADFQDYEKTAAVITQRTGLLCLPWVVFTTKNWEKA